MPEVRALFRPLLALLLVVAACADDGGPVESSPTGPGAPSNDDESVTYHGTIRALVEENCVRCHQDGGIAPFELTSYQALADLGPGLIAEVTTRRMPPWQADPECRTMQGERLLSEEAIAAFAAWGDADMPEGDPADYVAPDVVETSLFDVRGEPDLVLAGPPYTARRDRPDDYRCIPIEHVFEEDTFVVAADLLPDQRDIVHHALVFLVPPGDVGRMDSLSAQDRDPGYTCYGGPRVGDFELVTGWVPGSEPQIWPDDSAVLVPEGFRLVMQMHYNVAFLPEDEPVPEDQSELLLWTLPADEGPERVVSFSLFPNLNLWIPAGDPQSIHEITHDVPFVADVIGIVPHMHQLGTTISVYLERADGAEECLVHIPNWDFSWQQFYQFPDDEHIQVRPGDRLRLTCEFDNRPSNQPVVNGERLEPRDVFFGDSTFDEMCLHFLITSAPFAPRETGICGGFESCLGSCPAGDSQCALGCSFQGGQDCAVCAITGLNSCANDYCDELTAPFFSCFSTCDDPVSCFTQTCAAEYDDLYECLEPHIWAGECNQALAGCDVTFGG